LLILIFRLLSHRTVREELMELANKGLVKLSMQEYKLGDANRALHELNEGKVKGRAVLVP